MSLPKWCSIALHLHPFAYNTLSNASSITFIDVGETPCNTPTSHSSITRGCACWNPRVWDLNFAARPFTLSLVDLPRVLSASWQLYSCFEWISWYSCNIYTLQTSPPTTITAKESISVTLSCNCHFTHQTYRTYFHCLDHRICCKFYRLSFTFPRFIIETPLLFLFHGFVANSNIKTYPFLHQWWWTSHRNKNIVPFSSLADLLCR